jgi:hypothetical protein
MIFFSRALWRCDTAQVPVPKYSLDDVARARRKAQDADGANGGVEMANCRLGSGRRGTGAEGGLFGSFQDVFGANPLLLLLLGDDAGSGPRRASVAHDGRVAAPVHLGAAAAADAGAADGGGGHHGSAADAGAAAAATVPNLFAENPAAGVLAGGSTPRPPPAPSSALAARLQAKHALEAATAAHAEEGALPVAELPLPPAAFAAVAVGFGPQGPHVAAFLLAALPAALVAALHPVFSPGGGPNSSSNSKSSGGGGAVAGTDPSAIGRLDEDEVAPAVEASSAPAAADDAAHRHSAAQQALRAACLATDEALLAELGTGDESGPGGGSSSSSSIEARSPSPSSPSSSAPSGACLAVCVVADGDAHVAALGGCFALLCRNGRAVPLATPPQAPDLAAARCFGAARANQQRPRSARNDASLSDGLPGGLPESNLPDGLPGGGGGEEGAHEAQLQAKPESRTQKEAESEAQRRGDAATKLQAAGRGRSAKAAVAVRRADALLAAQRTRRAVAAVVCVQRATRRRVATARVARRRSTLWAESQAAANAEAAALPDASARAPGCFSVSFTVALADLAVL